MQDLSFEGEENINQILDILNSFFEEKFKRKASAWINNGYHIHDIKIQMPHGQASPSPEIASKTAQQAARLFSQGTRILDVEDEGQFYIQMNDERSVRLFDLLKKAGRHVSDFLRITTD